MQRHGSSTGSRQDNCNSGSGSDSDSAAGSCQQEQLEQQQVCMWIAGVPTVRLF